MKKSFYRAGLTLLAFGACGFSSVALASTFDISSRSPVLGQGERAEFEIFFNPDGAPINAISGELVFPSDMFALSSLEDGGSIIDLWVQKPEETRKGTIEFGGIIPGGFEGVRSPFYEGEKAGLLFRVVLTPLKKGNATLHFQNLKTSAHDGAGTIVPSASMPKILVITDKSAVPPPFSPGAEGIGEENFVLKISQNKNIEEGKSFIVFHDETEGVNVKAYQVAESGEANPRSVPSEKWKDAESPYVLEGQNRAAYIHVKSIDTSGKERFATLSPQSGAIRFSNGLLKGIIIFILLSFCISVLYRKHLWKS